MFNYYLSYIKFGLGRATSDTAHEIRDGHITRSEGINLIKRFDGEFPSKYFPTFLEYCNIDQDYFIEVIDVWRSPHLWKIIAGKWELIKENRLNICGSSDLFFCAELTGDSDEEKQSLLNQKTNISNQMSIYSRVCSMFTSIWRAKEI